MVSKEEEEDEVGDEEEEYVLAACPSSLPCQVQVSHISNVFLSLAIVDVSPLL